MFIVSVENRNMVEPAQCPAGINVTVKQNSGVLFSGILGKVIKFGPENKNEQY